MSQKPRSLSPDLKRLQDEGYSIEIKSGYLLLTDVPYVTEDRQVRCGTLVSNLILTGDVTAKPDTHVVMFTGDTPCDHEGRRLDEIIKSSRHRHLADGLEVHFRFSNKPEGGYPDYYQKMTTYANILSGHAQRIDPSATAQTFRVIETQEEDSVFHYLDTASTRADIVTITQKLACGPVAIIGLGGTGSYILDLIAKTPASEIHLFDGDHFQQHNAFRAPGAPSIKELNAAPQKAEYFARIYSKMRRNIFVHGYVDETNCDELRDMEFAFLSVDSGRDRKFVVQKLVEFGIPFIDSGMSVYEADQSLLGTLRVTASTPDQREHIASVIPQSGEDDEDEYSENIQIADLNALNAVMAVLKWKKLMGFYQDLKERHSSYYEVNLNNLTNTNDEQA